MSIDSEGGNHSRRVIHQGTAIQRLSGPSKAAHEDCVHSLYSIRKV